jgi:hypothetical protein
MLNWLSLRGEELVVRRTGEKGSRISAFGSQRCGTGGTSFAKACLDVTERRPHVAGALGAALAQWLAEQGCVERIPGSRAIGLRPHGRVALGRKLGLDMLKAPPSHLRDRYVR